MSQAYIWAEVFRPSNLDEVIIPDSVKTQFLKFIEDGQLPNLLLTSASPGTGKTTTARALCNAIGVKPLFINASLNNSIDDIRMIVMQYATTSAVSMFGDEKANHKVVIFDEADRLSANAMDALKGIIEETHKNCRFILTANNKNKIIAPLQSRLTNIEFRFTKSDSDKMMAKMLKRVFDILEQTQTKYNKAAVAGIVKTFFPDNRGLLTFLQMEAQLGEINEGSLAKAASASPETLIESMKAKKYKEVQAWVLGNADRLGEDFYEKLFKVLEPQITDQSLPQLVLILGEAQKYDSVVASRFLHFFAVATEVMMQVQFK
jgi:DNA polymerase III delta prime subunit